MVQADDEPKTTSALLPWSTPTVTEVHRLSEAHQLSAVIEGKGGFKIDDPLNLRLEPTRKDKYGGMHAPVRTNACGELEYTGAREWERIALRVLQHQGTIIHPTNITLTKLRKLVNELLDSDPKYHASRRGEVDPDTLCAAADAEKVPYRRVRTGRPKKSGS